MDLTSADTFSCFAGRVIEALLIIRGEEVSGSSVIKRILELTLSTGAVFSVYKAALEDALSESEMIKVNFNLPQLLEVWGAVIRGVESAAGSLQVKEDFLNTFKDTMIAKADEYPFLDPFAAKFQYKDGEVTFTGEVNKNFSQAIGDCLSITIETLGEQTALDEKDFFSSVRKAMDEVKENYQDQLGRFNISGILPDLF